MYTAAAAAVWTGLGALGGCAQYHAQPLKPAAFHRRFQHRSLTNPHLRKFIADQPIHVRPGFPRRQSLSTLVATGWYYSAALRMQAAQIALAQAHLITASQSPNPSVGLSPTYAAKAGPGVSPWILGFNFDIPIETAGRRQDRMAQALALIHAGRFNFGQTAWNVRQTIRRALLEYLYARRQTRLLARQAADTRLILSLLTARFKAGDISRPVYTAAQIQARQAALALLAARGVMQRRRMRLAAALSVPARALVGVKWFFPHLWRLPPVQALKLHPLIRAALLNRMDIQSLLARYQAAQAALKLQVARQYPDIHLGPGYSFNQGANEFTLGLTMALPVFNQNQGPIAAAAAHRRVIAADLLQKQTRVITAIGTALTTYRADLRQWRAARAIALRQRGQWNLTREAFAAGAQSRLALAEAQFALNTYQQAALGARSAAALALGHLENLLEKPLGRTPAQPKGLQP